MENAHHYMANANKGPIAEHMLALLPPDLSGLALEVGSGTGAQMEVLANAFPSLSWRPSEYAAGESVVRGFYEQGPDGPEAGHPVSKLRTLVGLDGALKQCPNVLPALEIDGGAPFESWPAEVTQHAGGFALLFSSNVVHIAPWGVARGIFAAAGRALRPGGSLLFHGPFKEVDEGGTDTYFVKNEHCDTQLWDEQMRGFDGEGWGIRTIDAMAAEGAKHGVTLQARRYPVGPSQNFLLQFIKEPRREKPAEEKEKQPEFVMLPAADADADLSALLTIVVTTSPVPSNPDTQMLEEVMASLSLVAGLQACRKVIVCDGYRETEHRERHKLGKIRPESVANYAAYVAAVRALCERGGGGFDGAAVDAAARWLSFSFAVERGVAQVATPFVMVVQHDRRFLRGFDCRGLLQQLQTCAALAPVQHVGLITSKNVGYFTGSRTRKRFGVPRAELTPKFAAPPGLSWHLCPLLSVVDSTHICRTAHYRGFVFGSEREHVGPFIEDSLAQQQTLEVKRDGLEAMLARHGTWLYDDSDLDCDSADGMHSGGQLAEPIVGHMDGRGWMSKEVKAELSKGPRSTWLTPEERKVLRAGGSLSLDEAPPFAIRLFEAADAPQVHSLFAAGMRCYADHGPGRPLHPFVESYIKTTVAEDLGESGMAATYLAPPKSNFWCAVDQRPASATLGEVIGIVGAHAVDSDPYGKCDGAVIELRRMSVHAGARGLGVATALIAALEKHASEQQISVVTLSTGVMMEAACKLYERNTYKRLGADRPFEIPALGLTKDNNHGYCVYAKPLSGADIAETDGAASHDAHSVGIYNRAASSAGTAAEEHV